jgi:NAD(P)H-hydrate epimerase
MLDMNSEKNNLIDLLSTLPPRPRDAHKGDFGHVLVIGGDYGTGGAVRLCAEAAARVGAGLVTVATRSAHVSIVVGTRPELMCFGIENGHELEPLLARATVVVIGPGLGHGVWGRDLWNAVCQTNLPLVVDADALNLLAEHQENLLKEQWILTPHPGEAGRLLKCDTSVIQQNRPQAIEKIQKKYGGVAVLKGKGTLVLGEKQALWQCQAGNPGMASGGMGDVLTGVIGGLVAQSITLEMAARLGVAMHALAADEAAKDGERGLLASDLMYYLRYYANESQNNTK